MIVTTWEVASASTTSTQRVDTVIKDVIKSVFIKMAQSS